MTINEYNMFGLVLLGMGVIAWLEVLIFGLLKTAVILLYEIKDGRENEWKEFQSRRSMLVYEQIRKTRKSVRRKAVG